MPEDDLHCYDFEKVGYQVRTEYNRVTVEYKIFGAPPGVKYVHVFWDADYMDRGFQRFTVREGKARRDDDNLWDLRGEFVRTLPMVIEPTTRRMRIDLHIEGLTGGCGRGRDYTLTPMPPPPPAGPTPAPSPDPVVNSITPDTVTAGMSIAVTIAGSNFVAGATVTFDKGKGGRPKASTVVVVDANTITATVTVKKGGPPFDRFWDVVVTNPDGGSGRLVSGFTVNP